MALGILSEKRCGYLSPSLVWLRPPGLEYSVKKSAPSGLG